MAQWQGLAHGLLVAAASNVPSPKTSKSPSGKKLSLWSRL